MSTSDAQHSADLSAETVSAIANLARLSLNDTQSAEYAQSLNKFLRHNGNPERHQYRRC